MFCAKEKTGIIFDSLLFFPEPELSNIAYVILSESAFANALRVKKVATIVPLTKLANPVYRAGLSSRPGLRSIPGVAGDRQRLECAGGFVFV